MRRAALAPILALLASCASADGKPEPAPPATGTVEGDVYFKTASGEIRKASGTRVLLLRAEDSVPEKMRGVCDAYGAHVQRLSAGYDRIKEELPLAGVDLDAIRALQRRHRRIGDSIAQVGRVTVARLDSVVWSAVADSVSTRLDAHFRFENVKAGRYLLWAADRFGSQHAYWMAPVTLEAGKSLTVDLNPERDRGPAQYCAIPVLSSLM